MESRPLVPRRQDSPRVPVVGMGTSGTLDRMSGAEADAVVSAALAAGTTLFDSSPMYGEAESILGRALGGRRGEAVVATKVWTDDDDEAIAQIERSLAFFGQQIEVMQVHNMVAWPRRLDQIERYASDGAIGVVGGTHWKPDGFGELEAAVNTGRVDMIQVPFNPFETEVERRLLPMAVDLGIGVLVMRPFANGALLHHPPDDDDLSSLASAGITTWTDALLAWGLSHPAVTATIPATSRPERAWANATAGDRGNLDEDQRALVARLARR